MKQILVTGVAGFLGSNLCKFLLEKDNDVVGIDNFITSTGENIKHLKTFPKFRFVRHDITKPFSKTLKAKLLTPNFIYHLACPTGVNNLGRLAEQMLLTCSSGTINILELAREMKSKVLFVSSSEVYGNPRVFPQKETYTGNVDSVGFRSPYEEGKRFSECMVTMYVRKYKVNAKIVRVFNTYGPGFSPSETRVIPRFIRLALANRALPVEGTGSQTRTFCYVDDMVDGLIMVMKKGKPGEVYNAGGDTEVSIKDIAKLILKFTHSKSKITSVKRPSHDHDRRLPDLTKIKKLGWKSKVSLEDGIQKILE